MSTATVTPSAPPAADVAPPRRKSAALRFVREQPLGTFGLIIILLYLFGAIVAVFAPGLLPHDPLASYAGPIQEAPSARHWFGTDQYGRDIFSRIVSGASTALAVGIISALAGCTIGALIGAASGYFGGRTDLLVQRLVDVLMSFPIIVLAMVVVAVLPRYKIAGVNIGLIAAIALPMVPRMARVARASTLSIVQLPFIDAARTAGFSNARIILRHIVPNIVAPYLIMVTAFIAQAILSEASLSFLGLGVTEPTPSWGLMLTVDTAFFDQAPWMVLFPGLAITLAVFAFNLFGDSLRDWLDPKLKV